MKGLERDLILPINTTIAQDRLFNLEKDGV